jgi:RNA-directed DNA polymerase
LEEHIKSNNPKLGFIRYADDFIVTAKDSESLENVLIEIKQWLSQRGLEISAEKTRIVNIEDGFNFLGFNLSKRILGKSKHQARKDVLGKRVKI